jgi:hypothetical protein
MLIRAPQPPYLTFISHCQLLKKRRRGKERQRRKQPRKNRPRYRSNQNHQPAMSLIQKTKKRKKTMNHLLMDKDKLKEEESNDEEDEEELPPRRTTRRKTTGSTSVLGAQVTMVITGTSTGTEERSYRGKKQHHREQQPLV